MGVIRTTFLALALATCGLPAMADVMNIFGPDSEPANSAEGIMRPTKGMSMDQVRKKFGEPLEELPAVGEPPITRWVYGQYTVYFERNLVIHSAIKH